MSHRSWNAAWVKKAVLLSFDLPRSTYHTEPFVMLVLRKRAVILRARGHVGFDRERCVDAIWHMGCACKMSNSSDMS